MLLPRSKRRSVLFHLLLVEYICQIRALSQDVIVDDNSDLFDKKVCSGEVVARYRLTFEADWSEENFPRQFPKFRPHAQWSKLIGRSHDETFELWKQGSTASLAFRQFLLDAKSDQLDSQVEQGFNGLFDAFNARPLKSGVGVTSVDFFVESQHSQVSLAAKLIPSPDWFVGVSRLDLCANGSWVAELTIDLDPLDGGVDRGFTFTSPTWISRPQDRITTITSTVPAHRASSFYRPDLAALPKIGRFTFELLHGLKLQKHRKIVSHQVQADSTSEVSEERERNREMMEEAQILHGEPINKMASDRQAPEVDLSQTTGEPLYGAAESEETQQEDDDQSRQERHCIFGDWSAWSLCSKTCGFGLQQRFRVAVSQGSKSGITECPPKEEEKWCGGMRSCRHSAEAADLFRWVHKTRVKKRHRRSKVKSSFS